MTRLYDWRPPVEWPVAGAPTFPVGRTGDSSGTGVHVGGPKGT